MAESETKVAEGEAKGGAEQPAQRTEAQWKEAMEAYAADKTRGLQSERDRYRSQAEKHKGELDAAEDWKGLDEESRSKVLAFHDTRERLARMAVRAFDLPEDYVDVLKAKPHDQIEQAAADAAPRHKASVDEWLRKHT